MPHRPKEYRDWGSNTDDLHIEELSDRDGEKGMQMDSHVKDGSHPKFGQAITAQLAALKDSAIDDDDDHDDTHSLHTDSSGSDVPTFYDWLGVESTASRRVIKKAFKAKVAELKLERDAARSEEEWDLAHAQVKNLEDMYRVLREEASREQYDLSIGLLPRASVPISREDPSAGVVEEIDEQATGQLTLVEAGASNLTTITEGVVLKEVEEGESAKEGRGADQMAGGETHGPANADNRRLQVVASRTTAPDRQNDRHEDQRERNTFPHHSNHADKQPVRSQEGTMIDHSQQRPVMRQPGVPPQRGEVATPAQNHNNAVVVHQRDLQRAPVSGRHPGTSTAHNAVAMQNNIARLPHVPGQSLQMPNRPAQMQMHVQQMHNPNGMTVAHHGRSGQMVQNGSNRVPRAHALVPPNFGHMHMLGGGFNPMGMAMNRGFSFSNGFTFSRTQTNMRVDMSTGAVSGSQRSQRVVRNSHGQVQMDSDQVEFERR